MAGKRRLRLANSLSSAAEVASRTSRHVADDVFVDEPSSAVESDRLLQSVAELAQSCPAVNHVAGDSNETSSAAQDASRLSSQ